jgi:predicted TIM-barrel fold metal-dependent hydrolase
MLIVDAQVHIWSGGKPTNANHRQVPAFTKDDLLKEMDAGGVDAALIHPPASWDPNSNELAVEAARQHPNRLAILGNFPLDRPESRALIDGWKQRPGMLGLRFTFLQPHQKAWPTDGTIDWLWPAAERAGIPVALLCAGFLPKVAQVAQQHPELKLIIDHLGRPSGRKGDPGLEDDVALWSNLPQVLALAKHPNVAIKATGAPSYSSEAYPYRNIHDHLRRIYDAFGPARMFWGTDITRMPCTWRQCVTMFTEELPWLSGRDRELVMGRAVCDWLGWKLPAR